MKLSYRGIQHESTQPTLEITEGEILGKYRGATWRCHTMEAMSIPRPNTALKYRGVAYNPSQPSMTSSTAIAQTQSSRPVSDLTTAALYEDLDRVHRLNLLQNLERRLHVARTRGDATLIGLLEAESKQLAQ